MGGLFDGTPLERPVTCERCAQPLARCTCPRNAAGEITLPADQPVRVRREKRRGKDVTLITGLDPVATEVETLAQALRSGLGVGGTVKDGVIELQGDQRAAVVERLRAQGYPVKLAGG